MGKLTTKDFIEKANKTHNFKYDYSNVNYINSQTKVEIICPEHGSFYQRPNDHKRNGCPVCGANRTGAAKSSIARKNFEEKANKIHKFKYDYSLVNYQSAKTPIIIKCKEHQNLFYITPDKHLRGQGCPICAKRNQKVHHLAWYKKSPEGEKLGFIYCLKFQHIFENEVFYKVGITQNIRERIKKSDMLSEYSVEVVEYVQLSNLDCAILESEIHSTYEHIRYIPNHKFSGWTECYESPISLTILPNTGSTTL